MKYLIGLLIVAFVAFVTADEEWKPAKNDEANRKIQADCIRESGLTTEQMKRVSNVNLLDDKEFHEYILCHAKRIGVFTEESGYNADRVKAQLVAFDQDSEKAQTVVDQCLKVNEEKGTPAVRAYRGVVCIIGKLKNDI